MNEETPAQDVYDVRFANPCSFLLAGSSGSGKTEFMLKLIQWRREMFRDSRAIKRVIWFYDTYQPAFARYEHDPMVTFRRGFDETLINRIQTTSPNTGLLVVVDDQMRELGDSPELMDLFTKSRHRNVSVAFLTQNLFHRGSSMRTVSLNANVIILFKMVRDRRQVATFFAQMYPTTSGRRAAIAAYEDATLNPYSYLVVDTRQTIPGSLRLRARVLPGEMSENYYAQHVYKTE